MTWKDLLPYGLALILAGVMVFFILKWKKADDELHIVPDPVTVTDTIIDWQFDTMYYTRTKVVKLPVHDTLVDSLWSVDSVLVDVPMYTYQYDTTLRDTNCTTNVRAIITGYDVLVDEMTVSTTVTPIVIKETIPWYKRFRPSVGVGIGTTFKGEATVGAYVGVGYLF